MLVRVLFLLTLLLYCGSSWEYHRRQIMDEPKTFPLKQQLYWFEQIIDHYNYVSTVTWQQRYFVYNDYYDPSKGPIILYICGEAECRGISDQSWTAQIAEQTQGLVLSLEHRYYGKSLPFGDKSFDFKNLKFLTVDQALKDIAYFISTLTSNKWHNINKNPWITIGGSYPGAMAAWFRSKYPHLTIGSISSSGVILAVEDFRMFDEQIYISTVKSGDFCSNSIIDVTNYVESQVTGENKDKFKEQFKAQELTARQFLFYWSDVLVFQVQYGNRVNFCNSLQNKTLEEKFNIMKQLALKVTPVDYGAKYLGDPEFALKDGRGGRSWIYQSCTEFSYFQTYAKDHPMRSTLLTIDFYRKWCEDIFGPEIWPYVNRVNTEFGGLNIKADNLIMTNGEEDPWQWASLQKSANNSNIYCKVIKCENCAHCVDLHAPNKHDAKDLADTRIYELESIKKWIKDYSW